jgi:hypothetical protein
VGSSSKDLRYLTLLDAMLAPQLLGDVFESDEAGDVQALVLFSSWSLFYAARGRF